MKNLKENKAITLVALIITIIVLLILAVVAINSVNGDGIISKAKNARKNYQDAQAEEQTTLDKYMGILNNVNTEETSIKIKKYKITGLKDLSQININDLPSESLSFEFVERVPNEGETDYIIKNIVVCVSKNYGNFRTTGEWILHWY